MTDTPPASPIVQPPPFPAFDQALELHRRGQLAEAHAAYETALAEDPGHIPSLVNIAVVLRRLGRLEPSLRYLYRVIERDPKQPGAWQNLGETLRRLKRFEEAQASFKKAAQDKDILLPAIVGLASVLKECGQFDEALTHLEGLLEAEPGNTDAWAALADALFDAGREEAAQVALIRAIRLKPVNAALHLRLAFQTSQRARYGEALKIYQAMLAQGAGKLAMVHVGLAQSLISLGRLEEAEAPLAKALELDPHLIDIYLARARSRFLSGRLPEAWVDYEWRKRHIDFTPPHLPVPVWDGTPLNGRTILLLGEQGAGDTIQFLRYVPLLVAGGGKVVLATSPQLAPLLARMPGLSQIVTDGAQLPTTDVYAHLLDLPALFKTDLASIPAATSYLTAPPVQDDLKIASAPGTRLKVGLAFAGNPRHRGDRLRSLEFSKLAILFGLDGVAFYSLQVGQALPEEAQPFLKSGLLVDLAPRIKDFADTAQLLSQLDLVISVDTGLVHLAGALGKPAWVLLPYAPDWRWLLNRMDSPWYPTLKLFRQPVPADWDGAVMSLRKALQDVLAANQALLLPSAFKREDGQARFRMRLPRNLLADPGGAFLVKRESQYGGYEYATRAFLDAHLQPGDLFLDIGAHWGVLAMHAASRWPGQVRVIAVEPDMSNAALLKSWIVENGLAQAIELVVAGCADRPGKGRLKAGGNSSMGFSVHPDDAGGLQLVSIDSLLDERPDLKGRRCIVKIDVEGLEPEVVAGMERLIASGQVAAIILERGRDYDDEPNHSRFRALLDRLAKKGFRLVRFANEQLGGPLLPFVDTGDLCNFIALAPSLEPLATYPRSGATQVIAPTQAQRARLEGEAKIQRVLALKEARASDAGFWADPGNLQDLADERAKAAAALLPRKGRILDLGAGLMRLRAHLPTDVAYVPADLVPWVPETLVCDLNQGQMPQGTYDAVALLDVLEYLHDPRDVLERCRTLSSNLVLSYRLHQGEAVAARRAQGWFNDMDDASLRQLLEVAGWRVDLFVPTPEAKTWLILAKVLADSVPATAPPRSGKSPRKGKA
jgi:FkbM family methyltransferase